MQQTQETQPIKELEMPRPHVMCQLVDANTTYLMASRGSFKTSRGISLYCNRRTYEMPRATGVITGLSFEHLFDNTIPPLLHAWDEFGFEHGVHYVLGQEPPKGFERPFVGPVKNKYDHAISWHNGFWWALVSLRKKASANGISAQCGVFDEAKFMDETQLQDEIFPIFRPTPETKRLYAHLGGYMSKFFATDKLADPVNIKWLLNKAKLNEPQKIALVMDLQIHLDALKEKYDKATTAGKQKMRHQVHAVEVRLHKLRQSMTFYCEASAYDVLPILGEEWLKDKKRNTSKHIFKVAFENKNPDKPGIAFYPDFSRELHTHIHDHDINPTKPFIIAADYQHSIAPIPVAQLCPLPGEEEVTINFVDEVYTMSQPRDEPQPNGNGQEGGLHDSVQLFCDRHKRHPIKKVLFVYDHTAIGNRVDADAYFQIVESVLVKNRWTVQHVYIGKAPTHFTKWSNYREWFKPTINVPGIHRITINAERCPKTIISIEGAPAKTSSGKTEKNKDSEKEHTLDQSETTHFSDAFDMITHAINGVQLIKYTQPRVGMGTR